IGIDELIDIVPAPDFPTAGIIYGTEGVREGYRTGRGRVVIRARTHVEDIGKGERQAIIVDEIPYQVNKANLLIRIGELVRDKKLDGISDLRDESDKSGMRVVIELKRGEIAEIVQNNLFKLTQLQDSFGMNMVALVDGAPRLLNLKQFLEFFLQHRREIIVRRTRYELRRARERGHILEGLAVALSNVDEIIALIKAAPTPPDAKSALMAKIWRSPLVEDMLKRAAADSARPEGLPLEFGWQDRANGLQTFRRAGAGDPRAAATAPDRPRAGQDLQRIQRGDGADRRPDRHPRQSRSGHEDRGRRAQGHSRVVRRRAALGNCHAGRRSAARGSHCACRHGRHAVAWRLHEGAGCRRIPGAKTRRARQAGDGATRRRTH